MTRTLGTVWDHLKWLHDLLLPFLVMVLRKNKYMRERDVYIRGSHVFIKSPDLGTGRKWLKPSNCMKNAVTSGPSKAEGGPKR